MDKDNNKDEAAPAYLAQLLPGATEWPHSDEALKEALKLRQEQERTKQEYYRLENRKRTLEILNVATRAGVAGSAIPSLFDHHTSLPIVSAARAAASAASSVGAANEGVEIVNYEEASSSQRSPTRFRPTHVRSSSAVPTFSGARPVTQAYYARPQQHTQPSSNLQFHHWKPSPRPEEKRRQLDRSPKLIKMEPPQSPTPIPAAAAVAAAHQQRRGAHVRHRSEASIPTPQSWNRTDEGASILASLASDRSKHDVGYILAPDRSPARNASQLQKSPEQQPQQPQTQQGLQPKPPPNIGQPGPVSFPSQSQSPAGPENR